MRISSNWTGPVLKSVFGRIGPLVHLVLISTFPVLAFYASNSEQIEPGVMLRPMIAALLLAGLTLGVAQLALRDIARSAVAASLFLVAFWSYGQLYDGLKHAGLSGETLVRHRYLLPVIVAVMAIVIWRAVVSDSIGKWSTALNIVAIVLWFQPVVRITAFELERSRHERAIAELDQACVLDPDAGVQTPDVYLIVMDAYERDDILREMHSYDNSPFIEALEARGFYVARGSMSNYPHTEMSLATVLNFDYLQNIPGSYEAGSLNRAGVTALITHSRLRRELECLGYYSVAVETGVYWSEWRDARYFFSREGGVLQGVQLMGGLTRTEIFLVNSSMLRAAIDLGSRLSGPTGVFADPVDDHRDRILFALEQLRSIPNLPGRKLVFAHIISPHPPMVFGPNGEPVTLASFETNPSQEAEISPLLQAYAAQVNYLNIELLDTIDAILERSRVSPIIVIQGDHGWADRNHEDKLSILNAIRFPEAGGSSLHPRITPVNTFRHALNLHFGGELEILDDVSYFSFEEAPFEFHIVPNTWSAEG